MRTQATTKVLLRIRRYRCRTTCRTIVSSVSYYRGRGVLLAQCACVAHSGIIPYKYHVLKKYGHVSLWKNASNFNSKAAAEASNNSTLDLEIRRIRREKRTLEFFPVFGQRFLDGLVYEDSLIDKGRHSFFVPEFAQNTDGR